MKGGNEGYCLVLSGGGAKGIYHVGAWQALRELKIPVDTVIGNSVGAVIAGFIVEDKFKELENIVKDMTIADFVDIPRELISEGTFSLAGVNHKKIRQFRKSVVGSGGLDNSPLEKLLKTHLSEHKLRSSSIDMGLVTYALSGLKPVELFMEDIPPGKVLSYIKASATFPGFQVTKIDGEVFIDGGVYDNMPYDMARSRGYKKIILIDISGLGVNKRPVVIGSQTIYIKNSIKMGGIFDFNRKTLDYLKRLGYLDTLRVFGRLKGFSYFIKEDVRLEKRLIAELHRMTGKGAGNLRRMLPSEQRHEKHYIYSFAEAAASILDLPRIHCYGLQELCDALIAARFRTEDDIRDFRSLFSRASVRGFKKEIKDINKNNTTFRKVGRTPYFYDHVIKRQFKGPLGKLPEATVEALHPGYRAGLLFLQTLERTL